MRARPELGGVPTRNNTLGATRSCRLPVSRTFGALSFAAASGARRSDLFGIRTAKHQFAFLRALPCSFRAPVKQNFLQVSYCSIHGCNKINFAVGYFVAAVSATLCWSRLAIRIL